MADKKTSLCFSSFFKKYTFVVCPEDDSGKEYSSKKF
jgi:hypothetical protein